MTGRYELPSERSKMTQRPALACVASSRVHRNRTIDRVKMVPQQRRRRCSLVRQRLQCALRHDGNLATDATQEIEPVNDSVVYSRINSDGISQQPVPTTMTEPDA